MKEGDRLNDRLDANEKKSRKDLSEVIDKFVHTNAKQIIMKHY